MLIAQNPLNHECVGNHNTNVTTTIEKGVVYDSSIVKEIWQTTTHMFSVLHKNQTDFYFYESIIPINVKISVNHPSWQSDASFLLVFCPNENSLRAHLVDLINANRPIRIDSI